MKPLMQIARRQDELVKFEWQEQAVDSFRKPDQRGEGETWAENCKSSWLSAAMQKRLAFLGFGIQSWGAEEQPIA
jgi:hypothetical protein